MQSKRILSWSIAFIAVLCVVAHAQGASIGQTQQHSKQLIPNAANEQEKIRVLRQTHDSEDSVEDSDEDDEEDDAEKFQQNLLQQQQQQSFGESAEDSEEDDDAYQDDVLSGRKRRQAELIAAVAAQQLVEQLTQEENTATDSKQEVSAEAVATTGNEAVVPTATTATTAPVRKTSVLILIRDALKKVTTELPTEQVASNALHYFQLFEHFLQQTIEQVIGDDDDEEEEATTIKIETEQLPELLTDGSEVSEAPAAQLSVAAEVPSKVPSEIEKVEQPVTIAVAPPVEDKKPTDTIAPPVPTTANILSTTTATPAVQVASNTV